MESVIFDNSHALEPRSTLPWRLQKTNFLGVVFDTCLGSGLEDDILREFAILVSIWGVPEETILGHLLEIN